MQRPATVTPRSPIWATLTLTWVNNLGAAAALIGVYFVAKSAYGFTDRQSLMLGLTQGVLYVAAAAFAGPGVRLLAGPGRAISTRTLLAIMQLALAGLCLLPALWRSPWSIWLLVGLYSPLTGWLWPVIESFLSSGRDGPELRRTTGRFNLAWSSSQVITFWALAPFMEERPLIAIPLLGLSHVLCLPVTMALQREPAPHDASLGANPTQDERRTGTLAACHQVVLVLSYVVYSALNPLLPRLTAEAGVGAQWQTPMTSVWMIARVLGFLLMERWGGWHGRFATLAWSSGLALSGFGCAMLAAGPITLALGLAMFGLGMGTVYSAAFYYAMEHGSAGVDAGGRHEAMIGLGYTLGPLTGLAAAAVMGAGAAQGVTVVLVAAQCGVAGIFIARKVRDAMRAGPSPPRDKAT